MVSQRSDRDHERLQRACTYGSGIGGKLHLIDFGAAREFPPGFVKDYLEMVKVGPGRTWMVAV